MTTERQRAANRANARRSTGPRSRAGRTRSAGNARRHGLTGVLPQEQVRAWYQLLLEDPAAEPDPIETDPYRRAVAALAEAEAHLARVRQAETTALQAWTTHTPDPVLQNPAGLDPAAFRDVDAETLETLRVSLDLVRKTEILQRSVHARRTRELRTLARYRAEAEAQRSKALRAFISARNAKS